MRQKELGDFVTSGVECPTCGRTGFEGKHGLSIHHSAKHGEKLTAVSLTCENCGDEYERRAERAKDSRYCSMECKNKGQRGKNHPNWKRISVSCSHCGDDVETTPSYLEKHDNVFCDEDCQYAYQTGENHPIANHETRQCAQCGGDITRCVAHFNERPFCDHDCYGEWLSENQSGPDSPNWKRARVECESCGTELWRKPHQLDGRTHVCSAECRGDWMSETYWGPNSPCWEGGYKLTDILRRCLGNRSWTSYKRGARESAAGNCEMCGESDPTQALDVHHIIPLTSGGCNTPELLMALCKECHMKAEAYVKAVPEVEPVFIEQSIQP